jgi:hypothetical protein
MKTAIQLLILIILTTSCESQEPNVVIKNIEINIPGTPGPWLSYKDDFYCYFKTDNDRFSSGSNHHFYVIAKDGQIKSKIEVPQKLQTFYYDLYIKNDTIFTTEYYNHNTFYLDKKNNRWIETKKGIDLYYEDQEYAIYSLDFGEWGGVTWFKNKQTEKQFEIGATSPIINKLGTSYYATIGNAVLKIDNPEMLDESKDLYTYQKAVLNERFRREGSNATNGTETIFKYVNDNYFNPTFSLATSFVSNDKLYHVYKDSISTKIGTIENKKLIPYYEFESEIKPFQWYYDTRNPIQNNNFQSFQFRTDKDHVYGIIEIHKNDVSVTQFTNMYKEPVFGEQKINEWFTNAFDMYYSDFSTLNLETIDQFEQEIKATILTQQHKMSTYRLEGKDVETPRIYRKIENEKLRLITMYYYSKNDEKIQLVNFQWGKNRNQKHRISRANTSDTEKIAAVYKQKFDWISSYLKEKLGEPTDSKTDKNGVELQWTKGEQLIILEYSQRDVELIIYNK